MPVDSKLLHKDSNSVKKKAKTERTWVSPWCAKLELTPVRQWRPEQHDVLAQLYRDGVLRHTTPERFKPKVPSHKELEERFERIQKSGSSLQERLELASALREQNLWCGGCTGDRGNGGRIAKIQEWQDRLQQHKRREMEKKIRAAQDRKRRILEEKAAKSKKRELIGWGVDSEE